MAESLKVGGRGERSGKVGLGGFLEVVEGK